MSKCALAGCFTIRGEDPGAGDVCVFTGSSTIIYAFPHVIFAHFVFFSLMMNLCIVIIVLNTVMVGPVFNRVRNYSTFSSRQGSKLYIFVS